MRLIDADALWQMIRQEMRTLGFTEPKEQVKRLTFQKALLFIKEQPTIEQPTWIPVSERLTIKERADVERICGMIERKCRDMMQPGMWERYTRHMECGEIREFAQYYRDMETVYKALTGVELFPQPPKESET